MSTFTVNCLDSKAHFETVSFDNIEYNSVNDYSMTSIEELADNIKKNGLLHNIVLSKQKNGKYKILAGERRTRAIQLLHEQEPESWMTTEALVYDGLTERQEEIIMDSSNLQSRGNGGDEVQLRKATNRYIENMKAEYGLSDKQALKAATDMAEAILAGSNNMLVDENAVKIAKETADNYATALIRTISEKIKDDFKTSYFIFMGGGSAMMRESIERAIDTKNLFFLTDVTANAKGYEIMARAKLTMSGEI